MAKEGPRGLGKLNVRFNLALAELIVSVEFSTHEPYLEHVAPLVGAMINRSVSAEDLMRWKHEHEPLLEVVRRRFRKTGVPTNSGERSFTGLN